MPATDPTRRRLLFGLATATAVGSGAALGSGAFTLLEARRKVRLAIVTDENAFLTFDADTAQYEVVRFVDGTFEFDTGLLANTDEGINTGAEFGVGEFTGTEIVDPPLSVRNGTNRELSVNVTLNTSTTGIEGLDGNGFRLFFDHDAGGSASIAAGGTRSRDSAGFTLQAGDGLDVAFEIATERASSPDDVNATLEFDVAV